MVRLSDEIVEFTASHLNPGAMLHDPRSDTSPRPVFRPNINFDLSTEEPVRKPRKGSVDEFEPVAMMIERIELMPILVGHLRLIPR